MTQNINRVPLWKRPLHMGWATLIMGLSVLLSRFMGLARDKVISYLFGATGESDLYFAAFVIPDFINYLLAGAYFSITLIPQLASYFEKDTEDGWRFFSAVFFWIGLCISLLTLLAMFYAPRLAHLAAPGLDFPSSARLTFFLRIILPAQVCFVLGSCLMAVLYLRKQFLVPALTPLIYNLLIIAGGILLRKNGMEGFCWGVLAGALLGNFALPLVAVWQGGGLKMRLAFTHPGLRKFILVALPLMLGQSIVVLDEQLIRVFGSLAGIGAISWLNYARRITMVPIGVVAQAAGVASYPFLAELIARNETGRFNETVNTALRRVLTLLIPVSIWMAFMAEPVIRLIFEQGQFGTQDTHNTAFLLRIMLSAVFCWGFQQILGRAFYAHQDTLTPAVLGTVVSLVSIPIYYFLARSLQTPGIALASSISIALYSGILAIWWKNRFGSEAFAGIWKDIFLLVVLSFTSCLPSAFLAAFIPFSAKQHPYLISLYILGTGGVSFALVFAYLSSKTIPSLMHPFLRNMGRLGLWLCR